MQVAVKTFQIKSSFMSVTTITVDETVMQWVICMNRQQRNCPYADAFEKNIQPYNIQT